jgi:hypothetical protein
MLLPGEGDAMLFILLGPARARVLWEKAAADNTPGVGKPENFGNAGDAKSIASFPFADLSPITNGPFNLLHEPDLARKFVPPAVSKDDLPTVFHATNPTPPIPNAPEPALPCKSFSALTVTFEPKSSAIRISFS